MGTFVSVFLFRSLCVVWLHVVVCLIIYVCPWGVCSCLHVFLLVNICCMLFCKFVSICVCLFVNAYACTCLYIYFA